MSTRNVRIIGDGEFRRGIRGMNHDLDPRVRRFLFGASVEVARKAVPKMPVGPPEGGHALSSIRPFSTARSAGVTGGGSAFPYYAWLEFGGRVGKRHHTARPFRRTGRYIWRAFSEERNKIMQDADGTVVDLGASFGIEVEENHR